jgi:hypothetical protein
MTAVSEILLTSKKSPSSTPQDSRPSPSNAPQDSIVLETSSSDHGQQNIQIAHGLSAEIRTRTELFFTRSPTMANRDTTYTMQALGVDAELS